MTEQGGAPEDESWVPLTCAVLAMVMGERRRQVAQYGHNDDVKDGTGPHVPWLLPTAANPADFTQQDFRRDYEAYEAKHGLPTWMHLVREEVAEAFMEDDPTRLAEELVQVAALCVSWVESLNKRGLVQ